MGARALRTGSQGARTLPSEPFVSSGDRPARSRGSRLLLTSRVSQPLAQKQNGGLETRNFLNRYHKS